MRINVLTLAIVGGCAFTILADAQVPDATDKSTGVYVANLHPMNAKVTGRETTGEARFAIMADTLTITRAVYQAPTQRPLNVTLLGVWRSSPSANSVRLLYASLPAFTLSRSVGS